MDNNETIENSFGGSVTKKRWGFSSVVALVEALVIVAAIVTTVILAVNYRFLRVKDDYAVAYVINVCTGDDISFYNNILSQGSDGPGLLSFVEKISAFGSHKKDPSCVFMLAKYYISTNEPYKAKEYLDEYVKLNNDGLWASSHISNIESVSSLKFEVSLLEKAASRGNVGDPNEINVGSTNVK